MSLLELFCGTKSVGCAALKCGYKDIVSVDIEATCAPTICIDIMNFDYKRYKVGSFRFIWASPPCTEFSFAKSRGVRKIAQASRFVKRLLEIIAYLKPIYFCVENPLGHLRLQPFMQRYRKFRQTVSYCRYGYKYRKNTDLWTNVPFRAKRCVKGTFCEYKQVFSHHMVTCQAGTSTHVSLAKVGNVNKISERYTIPGELLSDIFVASWAQTHSVIVIKVPERTTIA
jgi:site-specific DNA-cytosine methylase